MNQVIKHGISLVAGLDSGSQTEMRKTLKKIFSEAGSAIDFNTPENKKDIMALATVFRDIFESVGNTKIDFAKIMGLSSGEEMFKALKGSANELADVWSNVVAKMGSNSLASILAKDQSAIDSALSRITTAQGKIKSTFVKAARSAFAEETSTDINKLLSRARDSKFEFDSATSWEQREVAALRYLNVYRRIMEVTRDRTNVEKISPDLQSVFDGLDQLGPYATQKLEEMKAYMQTSLQNIFNFADGKSLIGLTAGGAVNFDVAPRLIKTLDVGDVLGGKQSVNIPVIPEIDPSFQAKLDKLRELYAKSNDSNEAYQQFEDYQTEMVKGLPEEMQEAAIDRLFQFVELSKVAARNYNAIWKDFIGYGYSAGTGGFGTGGGFGDGISGTGDGTGTGGGHGLGQTDGATTDEVQNLEAIRTKVAEVTSAVELKTKAFTDEAAAVNTAVESEIKQLGDLETKVKSISETLAVLLGNIKNGENDLSAGLSNIVVNVNNPKSSEGETSGVNQEILNQILNNTYAVKIKSDTSDENANKFDINTESLEGSLKKVFAHILREPATPTENTQEPWALDKTLLSVKETLDQIRTNTTPIVESNVPVQPKSMLPETRLGEIKELLSQINGKISGKSSAYRLTGAPTVTKSGGNLLKLYERLGALGVQKNALDPNSEERAGIKEKIRLLKEEINQKRKLVVIDQQLVVEAQKKGAADQRAQNATVGGRKVDVQAAKDTKAAVNDLLKAYERLGRLRAERNMLPQGTDRDELQKEIKLETSRLWKRSKKLGVDSTRTQEAADAGVHSVQMDQLIEKTKQLGVYQKELVSLDKNSESYKNTEEKINNLNREISLIQKKIRLTQEEKIELDKIRRANAEAVNERSNQQTDASVSSEQQKKVQRLTALYRELGVAEAKLENSPSNIGIQANISELKQQIQLEGDLNDALREQLEKTRQLAKEKKARSIAEINGRKSLREEIADNKKSASANKVASSSRAGRDILFAASGLDFDATEKNAEVQKLTKALEHLDDVEKRLASNDWVMDKDGDKEELAKATGEVNKYTEAVKLLVNSAKMFGDDNSISLNRNIGAGDIKAQLLDAANAAHGAKFRFEEFDDELQTITGTLKVGPREFRKVTIGVNQFTGAIRESQGALKKTETFIQSFKRKLSEISSYFSASSVIFKAVNELKKGIQYVRDIDLALTELKKVTDETEKTYAKFLDTAAKTADKVGSTIQKVVSSTADWARLGYSMEQAAKFAETTQILMNVSEFTDVSQATDTLISAVQAFGYTAETSMEVVDLLNTIGKVIAYR